MQILKLAKKYLINSQIYVSLMGTLLAVFFMLEQNIVKLPTILLIFITYLSGYLYTKFQMNRRLLWKIIAFNVLCGLISAALIIHNHNIERLFRWAVIVLLGLLYNSFFLNRFIRKIPLLKVFYVGFTWALINSWLILPEFNAAVFTISLLFVTALVLPFDIRDMKVDHVVTFPRLIGVQNTRHLAYVLIFLSLMISVFHLQAEYSAAMFITAVVIFILIYFAENSNPDSYFSVLVESCSGLPLASLLLTQYILL